MTVKGCVVLITGGAVRIGRAIGVALASHGAQVAFSYRTSGREARKTLGDLQRLGSHAMAICTDVSDARSVAALLHRVKQRYGRLDVLINNAAIFPRTPFDRLTEAQWDHVIDANLKGPFLCALAASRLMRASGGGKIINLADWAAVRPYRDYLPYCVSKAGVIGLTKALAKELAPTIQVNAIAPGPILAPGAMSAQQRTRIAKRTLLQRWGSPKEIANTVRFLIEGTDFMTGSVVFVDGGQLIA